MNLSNNAEEEGKEMHFKIAKGRLLRLLIQYRCVMAAEAFLGVLSAEQLEPFRFRKRNYSIKKCGSRGRTTQSRTLLTWFYFFPESPKDLER